MRLQGCAIEPGMLFDYEEQTGGVHEMIRDWQALRLGFLGTRVEEGLDAGSCCICGGTRAGLLHLVGQCAGTRRERDEFLQALGKEGAEKWLGRGDFGGLEVFSVDHSPDTLELCIRYGGAVGRLVRAAR